MSTHSFQYQYKRPMAISIPLQVLQGQTFKSQFFASGILKDALIMSGITQVNLQITL